MKLRVYGGTYDGTNRVIVAAKSRIEAHRALVAAGLRLGMHSFKLYGCETVNPIEVEVAHSKPGVVFSARNDSGPRVAEDFQEMTK